MEKLNCTLLVDDDETTNYLNEMLFDEMDLTRQLLKANNGQEAIDLIVQRCSTGLACPDLILLDINMPVMNGFEFLDAFNALELANKHSIIIMMLTTSLNPNDIKKADQAIISGFLNKPLTEETLRNVLSKHWGNA